MVRNPALRAPGRRGVGGARAQDVLRARRRSILPRLLENLLARRKADKREIKRLEAAPRHWADGADADEARDLVAQISQFDGRQLALKISANSVYGVSGSSPAAGTTARTSASPATAPRA